MCNYFLPPYFWNPHQTLRNQSSLAWRKAYCRRVCVFSVVSDSLQPHWLAHQAPLHGILQARILEWGALPTPGDVPSPEIELASLSFKKKLFIYFNWKVITLQYFGGFCHTLTWISHGRTYALILNVPHPFLRGCPSAPALSALLHASNLDWSSISHMVIYMFQCYSLKLSHPRLFPQNPKIFSLYLCLFYCLAYRVVVTIFLNSIYMH